MVLAPFLLKNSVTHKKGSTIYFRSMNIISEVLRGTWLLDSPNPEHYKTLATTLLEGKFQIVEKPIAYEILHQSETMPNGDIIKTDKVAIISMIGEMTKYGGECTMGASDFVNEIARAQFDPEIKGIILFIDGPGGNADAIPLFQAIKPKITKPIVALVDRACSLHYWVAALLSEHIMLNNDFSAECGSIGAMIMYEKPNNEIIIIRPPESKDKNQGIVDALSGDYKILEDKLSVLSQRFQKDIKENRPNIKEEALYGKTYYPHEAINVGLADSIGDINKAYELVLAKAELSKINK